MTDLLSGRYRLGEALGQGAMGMVYRGHDTLLERDVAVKLVSPGSIGTEGRSRLLREAQAIARMQHPNIVTVFDAGESDGAPYIVMELLEGASLLEHRAAGLEDVVSVTRQVCDALDHAHRHGIIHRDLKPENVIILQDGTAKLTDFGLARPTNARFGTETGISGTVLYLAPEQALGKELDGRTDLYSLGVMLYEMMAGRLPFGGDDPLTVISQHLHAPPVPPSTYNVNIPPALETLILQLMAKRADERPATAADVGAALGALLQAPSSQSQPEEPSELERLVRGRLVARERELADAKSAWQRATRSPRATDEHVLLITGEAGIGKTPLVRELASLVEVSRGIVLGAQCYADGGMPYAPVEDLIRAALDQLYATSAAAEGAATGALGLSDRVLADLITVSPALGHRYEDLPLNPALDPRSAQQRLFESIFAACEALIARGRSTAAGPAEAPLLIVVEDVHWADGGTLALLRHLARRSQAGRLHLLLALTYRESELDSNRPLNELLVDLQREGLATRIKLGRFDAGQTARVLATMFQQEVPAAFVDGIFRETDGNLFFIEEICKSLIEEGKVRREAGHWVFPEDMTTLMLPQTVKLAIQARLEKLPAQAQESLRLAAVFGLEFDFDSLQTASDLAEDELIGALETAQRAQLVREVETAGNGEHFAFAHTLTRSTLLESISGLRRRRMHRRVAEVLAGAGKADDLTLAHHFAEAGNETLAIDHFQRAGERARRLYANQEAIDAYSQALALATEATPQRFALLLARCELLELLARRAEHRADIEALIALAAQLGDDVLLCDAMLAQASYGLQSDFAVARHAAEQAVELARQAGDEVREGRALRMVGFAARMRGDHLVGREALETSVARFRAAGEMADAATSLNMLSLTLGDVGEFTEARSAAEEAATLSRRAGDKREEAISLRRQAIVCAEQREYACALPLALEALAVHRAVGDRSEEALALNLLGVIHANVGDRDESESHLRAALEIAEDMGNAPYGSMALGNLVYFCYTWYGRYEAALDLMSEHVARPYLAAAELQVAEVAQWQADHFRILGRYEQALQIMRQVQFLQAKVLAAGGAAPATLGWTLAMIGRLEAELGRHEVAREHLDEVLAYAGQAAIPSDVSFLLRQRAVGALLSGDPEELRKGYGYARRAADEVRGGVNWYVAQAESHQIAAEICLLLGDIEAAVTEGAEAIRIIGPTPFDQETFQFTYARALRSAGRLGEADAYLRRAHERVRLVASGIGDEQLRRSYLEQARVPRAVLQAWGQRPD